MVSDPNTRNPVKLLLITMLLAIVVAIVCVVLYLSLRQASFSKIEPYHVQMLVESRADALLTVEYDYGYGYNPGHQQEVMLKENKEGNEQSSNLAQSIQFTISAWKNLKSIRFTVPAESLVQVNSLVISKQGMPATIQRQFSNAQAQSNPSQIVVDNINAGLRGEQ